MTSILLSLASFWIPSLIGIVIHKDLLTPLLVNNPFLVYSVTFLSNAILTSISSVGMNSNRKAAHFRTIVVLFVFMYVVFLSSLIPVKYLGNYSISTKSQFVLLIITILIGVYVYGFRDNDWEKSIDDARVAQDERVSKIKDDASEVKDDGTGVAV